MNARAYVLVTHVGLLMACATTPSGEPDSLQSKILSDLPRDCVVRELSEDEEVPTWLRDNPQLLEHGQDIFTFCEDLYPDCDFAPELDVVLTSIFSDGTSDGDELGVVAFAFYDAESAEDAADFFRAKPDNEDAYRILQRGELVALVWMDPGVRESTYRALLAAIRRNLDG